VRAITAVVVAAVALVGLLAIADALRGTEEPRSAPATTGVAEETESLAATLREEVVIGFLVYSDGECRLHTLVLPELVDQDISEDDTRRCRFSSRDGWILGEREVLSPNWRFIAECEGGEIVVREAHTGVVRRRLEGCAPAWRPQTGNRLTWARGEAVYERGRRLLDRRDFHAIARRHTNVNDLGVPFRVRVNDLTWLDVDHLVLSLQIQGHFIPREYITVLLEGKDVTARATTFQGFLGRWFGSSAASFVAAGDGTIVTAGGETFARPDQLTTGRAVAFSPDERWLAFVTGQSIYLLGTPRNNEPGRIIRIPAPAQDLIWERSSTTLTFPPSRPDRG
jgi:hypothetical protein